MARKGRIGTILILPLAFIVFLIGWFIHSVDSNDRRSVRGSVSKKADDGISFGVMLGEEERIIRRYR